MSQTAEKHTFQAEIAQLLHLVVHSLYTDREIFVRELISNAADASEKLKFLQTSGQTVFQPERELAVNITTDAEAKTITFTDAGLGMTREELIENLGTIAHSGSRAFLEQIKAAKDNANLIGQFGVGFYSAFMVAEKVTVRTRSYRPEAEGCTWTSDGQTGYEIEPTADLPRGTQITLQLRDDEFANAGNIQRIIQRYSNFVPLPIQLNDEQINTVQALWTRSKSELTDSDYNAFYTFIAHDTEPPAFRLHWEVDAPIALRAVLFVPAKSTELGGMYRTDGEVSLYSRRVLIQQKATQLLPEWLRFLRGVVDSEDLPLNVSRETMQDSALMRKISDVLTKRALKWLDEEARTDADKYASFFRQHGHCLKEGVATSPAHHEQIGKLLRFESSTTEAGKFTSLADYVSRMPEAQKEIYYLAAPSREAAEASAHYEVFRSKNWEVLFLLDQRDEWVCDHLRNFDGKRLVAAEKADLQLDTPPDGALDSETAEKLTAFIKETLAARVGAVRPSRRLVGSPAVVVDSDQFLTASMRRMMKALDRDGIAGNAPVNDFEINPAHPVIINLENTRHRDPALAATVAEQLYDSALLAAGLLEDPRALLARMNDLLGKVLEQKS